MTMLPEVRIYHSNSYQPWGSGTVAKFYPAGQIPDDAVFTEIPEYDGIKFSIQSDDPTAKLRFDFFNYDTIGEIGPNDFAEPVQPNDTANMPSPGFYSLQITCKDGSFETLYVVKPRHLEWEYIFSMRSYLERRVSGITYDLLRRRSGMWTTDVGQENHWFNTFRSIWQHFSTIRHNVTLILENLSDTVHKEYRNTRISIHPDSKSQRWLHGKGLTKNPIPSTPMIFFEKRTELSVNTPENQWLVWFLHFLRHELKDIEPRFTAYEEKKFSEHTELKLKRDQLSLKIITQRGMNYSAAFGKLLRDMENQLKSLNKDIQRIEHEIVHFKSNRYDLDRMAGWISKAIHDSGLESVKRPLYIKSIPMKVQRDQRYSSLYRIYRLLKDTLKREKSVRRTNYPHLATNKLMEVYAVCLLCEILIEDNWDWREGWVGQFGEEWPTFFELQSGETMVFMKEGHRLEVAYDQKIRRFAAEGHIGFEAQQNDCPDIRLALYDANEIFVKAIIIEVKHRNLNYLIVKGARDISTDVNEQLKAYTSVSYHCPHRNKVDREAIDRVLCLYPKQDGAKPFEVRYRQLIRLIQIEPGVIPDEKPFGFNQYQGEILDFLQQYMINQELGA